MAFTSSEQAREAQKRAVVARRRNTALRKRLQLAEARKVFEDNAVQLAKELVDAALGEGRWAKEYEVVIGRKEGNEQVELVTRVLPVLDAKERANLIVKCLEFAGGRPGTRKPVEPVDVTHEQPAEGFEVSI